MNLWDFLTKYSWIVLIGTISSLAMAAVATIGGLYLFWPMIPIGNNYYPTITPS